MAQRRMFSMRVVDTDRFMDMPTSTQALYFHLGLHGDDDGFVASPRRIVRSIGCSDDDLRLLISKGYIIPFDSGVIVIVDWSVNNTLKNDRYHETDYLDEKSQLIKQPSGRYELGTNLETNVLQNGSKLEPELNITEPNKKIYADKPQKTKFVPPSVDEVRQYCLERGNDVDPEHFVSYYIANGWKVGRNKMRDWRAAVRTWERNQKKDSPQTVQAPRPSYRKAKVGDEEVDVWC